MTFTVSCSEPGIYRISIAKKGLQYGKLFINTVRCLSHDNVHDLIFWVILHKMADILSYFAQNVADILRCDA